jgi:hypothetical protein
LGFEVKKIQDGLVLTQAKYVTELLTKAGMLNYKAFTTHLVTSEKLSLHEGEPSGVNDSTQYCSIVCSLQYLTLTRDDIGFPDN